MKRFSLEARQRRTNIAFAFDLRRRSGCSLFFTRDHRTSDLRCFHRRHSVAVAERFSKTNSKITGRRRYHRCDHRYSWCPGISGSLGIRFGRPMADQQHRPSSDLVLASNRMA